MELGPLFVRRRRRNWRKLECSAIAVCLFGLDTSIWIVLHSSSYRESFRIVKQSAREGKNLEIGCDFDGLIVASLCVTQVTNEKQ